MFYIILSDPYSTCSCIIIQNQIEFPSIHAALYITNMYVTIFKILFNQTDWQEKTFE